MQELYGVIKLKMVKNCFILFLIFITRSINGQEDIDDEFLMEQNLLDKPEIGQGGVHYTRWGSRSCPENGDTELVYSGIMAGSPSYQRGGGANYLCMPEDPEYKLDYHCNVRNHLFIAGVAYAQPLRKAVQTRQVACAVCYVKSKTSSLMIPAKVTCPASWTMQYSGYIMTETKGDTSHSRYTYECIDKGMEVVNKANNNRAGVGLFHAEVICNKGLPCGKHKYNNYKELNCVVCTK